MLQKCAEHASIGKMEENRIVYDIGLQMTYKNTHFLSISHFFMSVCVRMRCVKFNAFIIRVNVHFSFRFISKEL